MPQKVENCQICKTKLHNFLDLGKQPLCDDLKTKPNSNKLYRLQIKFCKKCLTAFQRFNINKKILFPKNYHYRSSNTKDVLNGMKEMVEEINYVNKGIYKKNILDIGCNDGSLLDFFKKKGCNTYGLEPTGAFKDAKKKGHIIFNKFLDEQSAKDLKKKIKKIDVITFTNVFAHIENFKQLINSLKILIDKDTLLVIENHYLGEVINKNQFDTFYHEHPRTYSLNSFIEISKLLMMNIIKHRFVKRYNGNIRVYLKNENTFYLRKKINEHAKKEKKYIKKINLFQKKIILWKKNKRLYFEKLKKKFGSIPAKAFPGRASILVNILGLNKNNISVIFEKNSSLKVNKFVPGTNIKIMKEKYFNEKYKKKGIILNLAWHISSEIRNYLKKDLKFKGKIIDIVSKRDFR